MGSFGPFLAILWPFKDDFLSMTWSLPTTIAPKVQKVTICSFNMSCRRCLSFWENLFHGDSLSGSKDISPRSWPKNAFSQKLFSYCKQSHVTFILTLHEFDWLELRMRRTMWSRWEKFNSPPLGKTIKIKSLFL